MPTYRSIKITPRQIKKHGFEESGVSRRVELNRGRVSDVFTVTGGPCLILCMFMEVTEAVPSGTCNMSWVVDSDAGGVRVIADSADIAPSAAGDFWWAELDGTAVVLATTSTGLVHGGFNRGSASGQGTIVPEGGIDVTLSDNTLATGAGTLYVWYKPLVYNACIVCDVMHSSTTTSSSTTSTSSSSSSTSSTASTTSSTSSTASSTSSTSSSSSSSSTTSTTSSTTTGP